jgi:chromo domain-containing protein 1
MMQALAHSRTASNTSSEGPLSALEKPNQSISKTGESEQQKSDERNPEAEQPEVEQNGSEEVVSKSSKQRQTVQERPESSTSNPSRLSQQGKPKVPPIHPPLSPEKTSLFMNDSSPTEPEKRPRGRPPTRGKSATRGGAATGTAARKNVFEPGEPTKLRGRKPGNNLLKLASDPSKDPKMASNRHKMWKMELQGRDIAEAAPDISVVGGLFDPSDISAVKPIRPSTLRKSSSSLLAARDQKELDGSANLDDLFEERNAEPIPSVPPPSTVSRQGSGRQICFFWNKAQKGSKSQGCANGYLCSYLHHYEFGATVALPPPSFVEFPDDRDSQDKPTDYNGYYKFVCYYWDRAQQDSGCRDCSKGPACNFLHTYKTGVPVAPPPFTPIRNDDADSNGQDSSVQSPIGREQRIGSPPPNAVFSGPTVPQWRNNSAVIPVRTAAISMPLPSTEALVAQPTQQERPPWNPLRGNDAICHFWWTNGACTKGEDCKLHHSNDIRLAIAPSILEQGEIMSRITCPAWLQGRCTFKHCAFIHGPVPAPLLSEISNDFNSSMTYPLASRLAERVSSSSTEPSKRSVKFLLDEPEKVFDEPATISPIKKAPDNWNYSNPRTTIKGVCRFFLRGKCQYGNSCWNSHDTQNIGSENNDVDMLDRAEYNDSSSYDRLTSIPEMAPNHSGTMQNAVVSLKADSLPAKTDDTSPTLHTPVVVENAAPKPPRKKVNLSQYNQQKARKKIGARAKTVFFGQNELESITLDFGDIQNAEDSPWKREFPSIEKVTFGQICMAQDFEAQQGFIQRRGVFKGSLVAADIENQETAKSIEKIGDELVLRSAGLIASFPKFAILLFPASKEEWKYLEASSDYPKEGRLRYFVFETDWDINRPQNSEVTGMKLGEPYRRLLVNMIHGLDIKSLLPQGGLAENHYKFFMLFPPAASHIARFLATWLNEYNNQSKIYDSQKAGSWEYFRKTFDTGVVLVDETAAANLHLLPNLFEVLTRRNFNFWCMCGGDTVYPLFPSRLYEVDHSSLSRISATRLFPQGCAMLLTPSFLVAEPQRAYALMKTVFPKIKGGPLGTWKIVCAGNICKYLLDLAISKANEKEIMEIANRDVPAKDAILNDAGLSFAHCEARIKLHTLFARQDAEGLLDSPIGSDDEADFENCFHQEKDSAIVQADLFIDPDDEPALIEWFAAWSMRNLDVHRKFVVVGTGPLSAPRAKRMKEFVVVSEPDNEPHMPLDTLESMFRPFSLKKKNASISDSSSKPSTEAKRTALDVAAKLNALHAGNISTAAPGLAQESSASQEILLLPNNKQPSDNTKHGINDSLPTAQLQFCALTGGTLDDAVTFLAKSNNNLKLAIELYEQESNMDLDTQISQLFASVATGSNNSAPLRNLTAENDLARARKLVDVTASPNPATLPSASDTIPSARLPQYDGATDAYSPQYDGADDRPGSSGSASTTCSGIATNEIGQRFVPRSVRSDNSVRKEIPVRPGFVPIEDLDRYVSPGVAASRGVSRTASMRSSPALAASSPPPAVQEPDHMDIDGGNAGSEVEKDDSPATRATPSVENRGISAGNGVNGGKTKNNGVQVKKELRQHIFKDTVAWYDEYKRTNGSGWEHIFIGAHDDAIKRSGIVPTK